MKQASSLRSARLLGRARLGQKTSPAELIERVPAEPDPHTMTSRLFPHIYGVDAHASDQARRGAVTGPPTEGGPEGRDAELAANDLPPSFRSGMAERLRTKSLLRSVKIQARNVDSDRGFTWSALEPFRVGAFAPQARSSVGVEAASTRHFLTGPGTVMIL